MLYGIFFREPSLHYKKPASRGKTCPLDKGESFCTSLYD